MRVLIADDEQLARRALQDFLADEDGLELVGIAVDGADAARQMDALRPDAAFLDIRMPGLSGIEALERSTHAPAVVFTTAFDRFAVTAFELGAVDYLLKPFGRERFRTAVGRLRAVHEAGTSADSARRAREALRREGPLERFFVRDGGRYVPVETASIARVEASGDYVRVHVGGASHLLGVPLSDMEAQLDPDRFLRVHRSHLVNLDAVREVRPEDDRRLRVVMADGSEVVASRAGSVRLRSHLKS